MALPTTIGTSNQTGDQNSFHGPFISNNGDVFTILIDVPGTASINALRGVNPETSFGTSDGANSPQMAASTDEILSLNVVQDGDDLHIVTQNDVDDVFYARFDMSGNSNVGTWSDVTTTGGDKDQEINGTANGAADACDLVVRTGQTDVLAVFQWETESDMGSNFERIAFDTKANLTTGAWGGSPAYLGSNGMGVAIDVTGPRAVYEAVSGRTHVVYVEDAGTDAIHHSSISSSDTETANGDIAESPSVDGSGAGVTIYPIGHGVLFDRGGTKKIRIPYKSATDLLNVIEFDDAASPSYTFDGIDGSNAITATNDSINACLAVDGSQVHEMHARNSDSDLYTTDDADSDTWGNPVTHFFDVSDAGPTDPDSVWIDDSNAFDGSTSTKASTTTAGDVDNNELLGEGTDAPASGDAISTVRARIYGNAGAVSAPLVNAAIFTNSLGELLGTATKDNGEGFGSFVTLSVPSGGWTWTKVQALEVKIFGSASTAFTFADAFRVEVEVTTVIPTFTGTVNHISCNIYDRSGTKLAQIIDDGGTIKYDEDDISTGITIDMALGTLSISGQNNTITRNVPVAMDAGSLSVNGQTADITISINVAMDTGPLVLTGQEVGITRSLLFNADTGLLSLNGQDLTITRQIPVPMDLGLLNLNGLAATFTRTVPFNADLGTLNINGLDNLITRALLISPDLGSLSINGQDATITVSINVPMDVGPLSLNGLDPAITRSLLISPDTGSLNITGQTATFIRNIPVNMDVGPLSLTGLTMSITRQIPIPMDAGSLTINGQDADIVRSLLFSADLGLLTINGLDMTITRRVPIDMDAGALTLGGQDLSVTRSLLFNADTGSLTINGQTAAIVLGTLFSADAGSLTLNGLAATITPPVAAAGLKKHTGLLRDVGRVGKF